MKYCNRFCRIPFLLVVLAGCTLSASYYVDTPADLGQPFAITFSCEERWCNESWRGDRILRYNLSVSYQLRDESQHSGPVLNCMGGQVSTNCVQEGSGTAVTEELVTIVNRTLVSIEDMGPEGIIATDNFNHLLGELEGSYRSNHDKIWQIKIPQNCQLWILFEEFDVEPTTNCEKDYFSVQTSKNQPDIRKYCGSLESITIQRRRRTQLWFHSDDSVQHRGIFARYCFRRIPSNSSRQWQLRCDCNLGGSHTRRRRQPHSNDALPGRVQSGTVVRHVHSNLKGDGEQGQRPTAPLAPYSVEEMNNLMGHTSQRTLHHSTQHHQHRTRSL